MNAWTRRAAIAAAVAVIAGLPVIRGLTPAAATPVASDNGSYALCGRVFPDPQAYWPSPQQAPNESPYAKGNSTCQASDFLTYPEMIDGLTYLDDLFPDFVTFYQLERDFGEKGNCATTTKPFDYCSAGLPQVGASGPARVRSDMYMVRVTDERVSNKNKKYFVFAGGMHGIERAGAEAAPRAAEDLATWGYCEAVKNKEQVRPPTGSAQGATVNCDQEQPIPHPILEAQPKSLTTGKVLRKAAIYFVFPNPDGWRRGDPGNGVRFYQRYNGNGVDVNRDWPEIGYTFRPYTPWSEPESRTLGTVLKGIRKKWTGGIDLHGQLSANAFSYTLLGGSQRDFGKNQRILQTVKGAWADAEKRLGWSALIKPNTAPPSDPRVYGVQWGTVWDTIDYTVTGALGDWIDSPIGLGADGIDNEMSFSHVSNCGTGSCYDKDLEQLHVDGNKSLVYAMVNYSLLPEDNHYRAPGRVGYVFDPTVRSNSGHLVTPPPTKGLKPQKSYTGETLTPANQFTFPFTVKGPSQGVYNGGIVGKATPVNVSGVSPDSLTSLVIERLNPRAKGAPDNGCGADGDRWEEVNRYFNQSSIYLQSGQAVQANGPLPGKWRICITGEIPDQIASTGGYVSLDVDFTKEAGWADPGQLPYHVTNMQFFKDLVPYMKPGQLVRKTTGAVLSGGGLSGLQSLVIADDPLPTKGAAPKAKWGAILRRYVKSGGDLVLTDGAIQDLIYMGIVPANAIHSFGVYAGYVGFTRDQNSSTYSDVLASGVNQPGAAQGSTFRHQTYEPVPIGYAIQTASGDDAFNSPVWSIDQKTWERLGGRTVGTTGEGKVTFGELRVGRGVIRIIGALLPMPSEHYYHPFGLSNYALTYTGYQILNNSLHWCAPSASFRGRVLAGTSLGDTIAGTSKPEMICSFFGKDTLSGGGSADRLLGGPGNDLLDGGPGHDVCIGGPGKDKFKDCEVKRQ